MYHKKQARKVFMNDDTLLTFEEYEDYLRHAYNTIAFWAGQGKTKGQIKDKLLDKGYKDYKVYYLDRDKEEKSINFIEEAMLKASNEAIFIDESVKAKFLCEEASRFGLSPYKLKEKLIYKEKIDRSIADESIEYYYDEFLALTQAARKEELTLNRIKDSKDRRNKMIQKLLQKGFNYSSVKDFMKFYDKEEE